MKRLIAVSAMSSFLAACASGPVGGPVVEDLSLGKGTASAPPTSVMPIAPATPVTPAPAATQSLGEESPKLTPIEDVTESVAEPLRQPAAQPQVQSQTPVATPVTPLPEADKQVVESLLYEADQAKARSDSALAIMKLQQAQRIAPREPKVYARLAALYLADGQAAKAEQLSRKGLTLVAHSADYSHYFWRVIAACRRYQGDEEGEAAALKKARQFK